MVLKECHWNLFFKKQYVYKYWYSYCVRVWSWYTVCSLTSPSFLLKLWLPTSKHWITLPKQAPSDLFSLPHGTAEVCVQGAIHAIADIWRQDKKVVCSTFVLCLVLFELVASDWPLTLALRPEPNIRRRTLDHGIAQGRSPCLLCTLIRVSQPINMVVQDSPCDVC